MKQRSIWIVEDNPAYAKAIGFQMKALGVNCYVCSNVTQITPIDGDLVLLDLMGTDSEKIEFGGGVEVYTMSACPDFNPNFIKPLSQSTLRELVDSCKESKSSEKKAMNSVESLKAKFSAAS